MVRLYSSVVITLSENVFLGHEILKRFDDIQSFLP